MKVYGRGIALSAVLCTTLLAGAADSAEVEVLRQEVQALKQSVAELKNSSESASLQHDIAELKAGLESNSKGGFQIAGYAAFDWQDAQGSDNEFSGVKFAPIFHAQYGDIFQFEGEVEFSTTSEGETDAELEYAAGTIFLNDYMGLQIGKFMSPLGQFVQNQHPSWINKLPNTPVGFGHDGAAPTSNVGMALRGGLPKVSEIRSNYVLFVSNAPVYGVAADGDVIIDATGKTSAGDVSKTWGGRFALNPVGGMEVGVSGALGKASEELISNEKIARDYDAFGVDFMYNFEGIDIKAEYIEQSIGENELSTLEGGTWRAMYGQVSYQFASLKLEPVLRYSDYHNPETERNQWAVGLNYLFANNLIAKLAYEYNTNEDSAGEASINDNRVSAQLAFGF